MPPPLACPKPPVSTSPWAGTPPGRPRSPQALEEIFCQLTIDTPTAAWALQYRLAGHRSLSVGDVVTLGETAWAGAPLGWTPLTADQLRLALPS
jgi:hypothetical protein